MPLVQITLIEGRDKEIVKNCMREVARTVHRTLGAPMPSIRVIVTQLPASQWAIGDEVREDTLAAAAAKAGQGS